MADTRGAFFFRPVKVSINADAPSRGLPSRCSCTIVMPNGVASSHSWWSRASRGHGVVGALLQAAESAIRAVLIKLEETKVDSRVQLSIACSSIYAMKALRSIFVSDGTERVSRHEERLLRIRQLLVKNRGLIHSIVLHRSEVAIPDDEEQSGDVEDEQDERQLEQQRKRQRLSRSVD